MSDLKLIDAAFYEKGNYNNQYTSDFYLTDDETGENFLIELKAGGDLDNKKAKIKVVENIILLVKNKHRQLKR